MNDILLKKLAMQSFSFLVLLCVISYITVSHQHTVDADSIQDTRITEDSTISVLADDDTREEDDSADLSITTANLQESESDSISFDATRLPEDYLRVDISDIDYKQISIYDDYRNRCVELKITGLSSQCFDKKDIERLSGKDYRYGKAKPSDNKDLARKLTIHYDYNPSDFTYDAIITVQLKKFYAPSLMTGSTYCYVLLNRPKDVYDKIVVIDAGHGGNDTGTYSRDFSCVEPTYTLAIAEELKKYLDDSSIKAYYTRTEDVDVSMKNRTSLANSCDADFLISIHCNGVDEGTDLTANGMEALYVTKKTEPEFSSRLLALTCLAEMTDVTGRKNRGVIYRDDLYLLNNSQIPATILEVGFMSNKQDMNYLNKRKNLKQIAKGIYNGIEKAYEKRENIE